MTNRWFILFVLFFARLTMAFQFQSVAALSPLIIDSYAISLADIGLLIGLYLGPGVVIAIPGGAIAARFGDRRVVALSLGLMLAGGVLILLGSSWSLLIAGRVLAGVGGVIINIVMTKMLVDWFAGREIATAMGLFVSSWPVGISLALLILPNLAVAGGVQLAWASVAAAIGLALVLFLLVYRAPESVAGPAAAGASARFPTFALSLAASIWGLYNTALAMVFGFGPLFLSERGLPATTASSVVGVFIIFTGIGIPLGGILADRTGRRDAVILASLATGAVLLPAVLVMPLAAVPAAFAAGGLIFGLAAGPVMALPSLVLPPEVRAFGMGVFFAVYYGLMMVAPAVAGGLADRAGRADVAFVLGAGMLAVCVGALALFRRVSLSPIAAGP